MKDTQIVVCICIYIYVCNRILFSHKKNEILPLATILMDPEGIMPGEISQRERQVLYDLSYMWNLKEKKNSK